MTRHRIFYGWITVASTHVVLLLIFGIAYSFAAFFNSFAREFSASRGDVSLVFALSGFLYFLVGAFAGTLADRVHPRLIVSAGVVFICAGLMLASFATSIAMLYVTYGLGIGFGIGFAYVPSVGALQPWFFLRRGFATGVAVMGIGIGTLLVPILTATLIAASDWRVALRTLCAIVLPLGLIAATLIDNDPRRHGVFPDNADCAPPQSGKGAGLTLGQALKSATYWRLFASCFGCSLGLFVPFAHLAPYARDHGLSERQGVLLVGLIGVGSIIGRFALSGLADRFGRSSMMITLFLGMAAMMLVWLASSGFAALALFSVVFGILYGGFVALSPPLYADYFGARNISGIIGTIWIAAGVGHLLGPALAGFAYDAMGSYRLPILVCAGGNLVAAGAMWGIRQSRATSRA
jgi:MFS family permease